MADSGVSHKDTNKELMAEAYSTEQPTLSSTDPVSACPVSPENTEAKYDHLLNGISFSNIWLTEKYPSKTQRNHQTAMQRDIQTPTFNTNAPYRD